MLKEYGPTALAWLRGTNNEVVDVTTESAEAFHNDAYANDVEEKKPEGEA